MTRGTQPALDEYRRRLLARLEAIASTIEQSHVLRRIFDAEWKQSITAGIKEADLSGGPYSSQRCPLFFLFQDDPSRLRVLDRRLSALGGIAGNAFDTRIQEIRACRFDRKQLEHFFELGGDMRKSCG
ncbi:MAG: hypothetical protein WBO45_05765 [Planctomycetota bacterium]